MNFTRKKLLTCLLLKERQKLICQEALQFSHKVNSVSFFQEPRSFLAAVNRRDYSILTVSGCTTFQKQTSHLLDPTSRHLFTMKLETAEFKSIFTPELETLIELFKKYGYELRLAGGAVRDLVAGGKPSDLDFATTATPDQMKEMFTKENIRMINMKGEKHGTITARINDKENFEITTLRIDVVNHGRHADVVFTQDWELDANRRDLTINSMFLDFDGTLVDYFGGYEDLLKRHVVFVGDARQRIQEDYLRILRYFRFFGRISADPLSHHPDNLEAIRENMKGLEMISGERIWVELKKIFAGSLAGHLVPLMIELGIAPYVGLPQTPNIDEFRSVWERSEKNRVQLHPITLLSSLLSSEEEVAELHLRLKLSAYERDLAFFLVQHRLEIPCEHPLRPYQWLLVDCKNKQSDLREWILELFRYQGRIELISEFSAWKAPRFPVSGNALKDFGIPGGKQMNIVMNRLRDDWKASNFELGPDELVQRIPDVIADLGIKCKS